MAGYGFRTDRRAHDEVADHVGMPVISLELVDPRFYHLDTALAVLDDDTIAYYPPAFASAARAKLAELFPDAIEVASADAYVLGLNVVSDGLQRGPARGRHRLRRTTAGRPASGPSAWISPSCSRAADPSNAARWRYTRDDPGYRDGTRMPHTGHRGRDRTRRPPRRAQLLAAARRRRSAPKASGSPTSRAVATSTASPRTRRSTSVTAIPEITATAHAQLDAVTLVSRAFHSDRLAPFCAALAGCAAKTWCCR